MADIAFICLMGMKYMDPFEFHDAVLISIEANWKKAEVVVLMEVESEHVSVNVSNFSSIFAPRRLPWGNSFYINETALKRENGEVRFEIEMQTGDVIIISGDSIAVNG
ncbi:MAG TPA: hypothetical protein V6D00_06620 [Pantanalinema sp.]